MGEEGGFGGGAGEPLGFCQDSLASSRNSQSRGISGLTARGVLMCEWLFTWPPPSILQVSQEVAASGSSDLVLVLVRVCFFPSPVTLSWL